MTNLVRQDSLEVPFVRRPGIRTRGLHPTKVDGVELDIRLNDEPFVR
ncbi:MAG TPA: hypothetical protein VGJ84_11310 [Polyangiaceae bacterium]